MSRKEIERVTVLRNLLEKKISQINAAKILKLTTRQVRTLTKRFESEGEAGIISKKRGYPSNRRLSKTHKSKVLKLVSEKYTDFGPTLAKEKLEELDHIGISIETLRKWMIESHLWVPRRKRKRRYHTRKRRSCFGELIQIDGSHHHWLGEDQDRLNLTVFIDDATGKITSLYFSKEETLDAYFMAMRIHLEKYGRPLALYSDRYAVFQGRSEKNKYQTQFSKALKSLDVELILANSPQAKGRVERANRTLQDRLLRELKLKGIKTIDEANEFCREFIELYNKRFFKKPESEFDAHRPLKGYDLERILCRYETRTLSSDLSFQFNNRFYRVQGLSEVHRIKGRKVEVRLIENKKIRVFLGDKEIEVKPLEEILDMPKVLTRKQVLNWKPSKRKTPSKKHPWRRKFFYREDHWNDERKVV